jgi:uncharacterized protein YecT (DUF1311 family)
MSEPITPLLKRIDARADDAATLTLTQEDAQLLRSYIRMLERAKMDAAKQSAMLLATQRAWLETIAAVDMESNTAVLDWHREALIAARAAALRET